MTGREFYVAITNTVEDKTLVDYAKAQIAKLDERNAQRANKPSKKALENEPIKAKILEVLEVDEPKTASDIASLVDITTSKASALCGQLVKEKKAVKTEVKIPKVGKRNAYALIA